MILFTIYAILSIILPYSTRGIPSAGVGRMMMMHDLTKNVGRNFGFFFIMSRPSHHAVPLYQYRNYGEPPLHLRRNSHTVDHYVVQHWGNNKKQIERKLKI